MIIVQFLGSLECGGAESVIRDYSLELSKRGHEIVIPVYYSVPDSPIQREVIRNSIRVDVIHKIPYAKGLSRIINKLLTITGLHCRYLKKLLREFNPDVLHLHGYVLNDFAHISKELEGIKLFYTCHNPVEEFFKGKMSSQYDIAKRLIKENKMRMIALHSDMAKDINNLFDISNTLVLHNPIDGKRFVKTVHFLDKQRMKESFGIPGDAIVIGNVGRFVYQKNQDFLIDIFEAFHSKNKKSVLIMIGGDEGECYNQLIDKVNKKELTASVIFLRNRNDMPQLYSIMDTFVLTSLFEGFCIALVEAQMSGLSCVVSDVVPKDAILSGNVVLKSINESIEEWVESIEVSISNNTRKCFDDETINRFGITNIVNGLLDIYNS